MLLKCSCLSDSVVFSDDDIRIINVMTAIPSDIRGSDSSQTRTSYR
jgi:hypothetical protein